MKKSISRSRLPAPSSFRKVPNLSNVSAQAFYSINLSNLCFFISQSNQFESVYLLANQVLKVGVRVATGGGALDGEVLAARGTILKEFFCGETSHNVTKPGINVIIFLSQNLKYMTVLLFNTYSMKQPDLYYFETIKMTSQAWSNFVWRI